MNRNFLDDSFGTLSETINELVKLGYTHDFNIQQECLVCHQTNTTLSPNDFQIDKVYRFEGVSDPEDQSILYAISSMRFSFKGILVNGYGIYTDEISTKLIEKLQANKIDTITTYKSNDATPQRPEGNRLLNAPLVEVNLQTLIDQIKRETTWSDSDRNSITIFKSETMRIVLMGLHENAELKPHKANGVVSVHVLEGKIDFITEQRSSLMGKGQIIALQENVIHSIIALTETFFLLTLAMNGK